MSVLASKRDQSTLEFYHTMLVAFKKIATFVMSDKHVPKKWRFTISNPIIDLCQEILDNIVSANSVYVKTKQDALMRNRYQRAAINGVHKLTHRIQYMIEILNVFDDSLQPIAELLEKELTLLNAWKKSDEERYKSLMNRVDF